MIELKRPERLEQSFYYYGPGGGGVEYPDQYFLNLKRKTLLIIFDGPYIDGQNSVARHQGPRRTSPIFHVPGTTFTALQGVNDLSQVVGAYNGSAGSGYRVGRTGICGS